MVLGLGVVVGVGVVVVVVGSVVVGRVVVVVVVVVGVVVVVVVVPAIVVVVGDVVVVVVVGRVVVGVGVQDSRDKRALAVVAVKPRATIFWINSRRETSISSHPIPISIVAMVLMRLTKLFVSISAKLQPIGSAG
jgi:hypothetical protein